MDAPNPMDARRCSATSRSGEGCKRWAIVGGNVCPMHGGGAPQVKQAAADRLQALVDVAITALEGLLAADSEVARLSAVKDVLDRAGYKPVERVETEHSGPNGTPARFIVEYVDARPSIPAASASDAAPDQG